MGISEIFPRHHSLSCDMERQCLNLGQVFCSTTWNHGFSVQVPKQANRTEILKIYSWQMISSDQQGGNLTVDWSIWQLLCTEKWKFCLPQINFRLLWLHACTSYMEAVLFRNVSIRPLDSQSEKRFPMMSWTAMHHCFVPVLPCPNRCNHACVFVC